MKTLNRLLIVVLSVSLVVSVYAMHTNTTQFSLRHDMIYHVKWPWLHVVREVSLFGVLAWSVIFVRREPTLVRVGLIAMMLAFIILNLPVKDGSLIDVPKAGVH